MDIDDVILELNNGLNKLVEINRNYRVSFFKNCRSVIDSYQYSYQQDEIINNYNLKSIIRSFEKLNLSNDSYFDISQCNKILDKYAKTYSDFNNKEIDSFSNLGIVFQNTTNVIKKNHNDNKLNSCNFNALKFFNINETLHSQLIFSLLNPNSEHGQEKLFLKEFLVLLNINEPEKGEWKITAETGRIDILLKRVSPEENVIIVENKSKGAVDQPNQLYRYWYQEIYLKTKEVDSSFYEKNKNKYKIIYLPSNFFKYPDINSISKPQDEDWLKLKELPDKMPIDYEIRTFNVFVIQWLNKCLETIPESNHRMIEYLKQYIEICYNL